jgi:Na+:H+ antiporter, NhaA family
MSRPAAVIAERPPTRFGPRALREFLATEAGGGVVLLVAAIGALVWANSPWDDRYTQLWHAEVVLRVGVFEVEEDLQHLVNDGLMAVFFFVVGLEIKRELVDGDLRRWRTASLPAIAALGGMVVPALLYGAVNAGADGSNGWGVPMATDIAFAVGVLAILGDRVPSGLKLFLLTLAIVDDIGAIVIVAVVYSDGIDGVALAWACALVAAVVGARVAGIRAIPVYAAIAVALWYAVYRSGVHATIAGVVLGLLTPARARGDDGPVVTAPSETYDDETASPAERLQHALHPLSSYVVVPVFALANAGVAIDASALEGTAAVRVAGGVALGLIVGKVVGITGAAWLAVRLRLGVLPDGTTWPQLVGVAAVAGIGFTVALFIAGLAYDDAALADAAKVGILGASVVAAILGVALLSLGRHRASAASAAGPTPPAWQHRAR